MPLCITLSITMPNVIVNFYQIVYLFIFYFSNKGFKLFKAKK